jgi:hypothetical protein
LFAPLAFDGLPPDFFQRYQVALRALTAADVAKTIRERFRPDAHFAVATGTGSLSAEPLSAAGLPVHPIDLTIAAPKPSQAVVDAESLAKGREWLARVQQAMGGADRLAAVRDYRIEASGTLYLSGRAVPVRTVERWIGPETYRQDQTFNAATLSVFYNGKIGWSSDGRGLAPLNAALASRVRGELFRLPFRLMLSDRAEGRTVAYQGSGVLYIQGEHDQSVRIFLNEETALPRRLVYLVAAPGGSRAPAEETLEDWRAVEGVTMPFRTTLKSGGVLTGTFAVTGIQFNSGLSLEDVERKP